MKKELLCMLFMLTLLATMISATQVKAVPNGPVGIWHLDEGETAPPAGGGSIAYDSSGMGNNGNLSGGKFGNGLLFDGTSGYVNVSDAPTGGLDGLTALTVEAWIKPDTVTIQSIVSKLDIYTWPWSYDLLLLYNEVYFEVYDATGAYLHYNLTSGANILAGQWYHVAGTWEYDSLATQSVIKIYVDGVEIPGTGYDLGVSSMADASAPVNIGSFAGTYFFDGVIDEVRISNIARTSFDLNNAPSVDADTVALWHFDESMGTTVYDETANDFDGDMINGVSWNGPVWTSYAKVGSSALSFDGINDYVNVLDDASLNPTSAISVEAWFNATDITGQTHPPIVKKTDANAGYALEINSGDSMLRFWVNVGGTWISSPASAALSTLTWYHAVGTYDGSTVRLYVDGVEQGTGTAQSGTIAPASNPLRIGTDPANAGRYFNGIIDEVRIYNKALSANEIALQYLGIYEWRFLPPYHVAKKTASTFPLKFALYDAYGNFFTVPSGTIKMLVYGPYTSVDPASGGPTTTPPAPTTNPAWNPSAQLKYNATTVVGGISESTFPKDSTSPSNDYRLRISSDNYIVNWHTNIAPDPAGKYLVVFVWKTNGTTYYWWYWPYQLKAK